MKRKLYWKYLSLILAVLMFLSMTACENKLEKDLRTAKKKIAQKENQEEQLDKVLNSLGVDTEDIDLSTLDELGNISEMTQALEEDIINEDSYYEESNNENLQNEDTSGSPFQKGPSYEFLDVLCAEQYYMEYTCLVMGMEGTGKSAVKGKNSSTITEMMGYSTWSLILDGYQYDMDMTQKKYTKKEIAEVEAALNSMQISYSDMEYVGNGYGEIPGMSELSGVETKDMDYEEYQIAIDYGELAGEGESEMLVPIRFYMDNDQLYAIYTQTMGIDSIMMIKTLTKDIPQEMFEIPGDYSEVESLY